MVHFAYGFPYFKMIDKYSFLRMDLHEEMLMLTCMIGIMDIRKIRKAIDLIHNLLCSNDDDI